MTIKIKLLAIENLLGLWHVQDESKCCCYDSQRITRALKETQTKRFRLFPLAAWRGFALIIHHNCHNIAKKRAENVN
jgi:hypothetical protein